LNHFKDFTCYSLDHFENAKNIGWMQPTEESKKYEFSIEFLDKLWEYVNCPFNKQRNTGALPFCYKDHEVKLGYSEIRVLDTNGTVKYASPDIIFKYILEGQYMPPDDFKKAVIEGPKPGSKEYDHYILHYNEKNLWGESEEIVIKSTELRNKIIQAENSQIINLLNKSKIDIDILTKEGSILNTAILHSNLAIAEYFIEFGININKFSGAEFINAVANNAKNIVELLIKNKTDLNLSSPSMNPLFIAIRNKNIEMTKILLEYGIDPNIKYTNEFMKDMDALQLAQRVKCEAIVNLLQNNYK